MSNYSGKQLGNYQLLHEIGSEAFGALQNSAEQSSTPKGSAPEHVPISKKVDTVYEPGHGSSPQSHDQIIPCNDDTLALVSHCITKPFVEKALAQLSWFERSCLLLHIDGGFSSHEIAGIMNIQEQEASEALVRGREQLLRAYYLLLEQEQILSPGQLRTPTVRDDARIAVLLNAVPAAEHGRSQHPVPLQAQSQKNFSEDNDPDPEETLARFHPYIVALVKQRARRSANFARPGQFDLEVDEMVQRVLIKFWQALAVKHIEHHKAYLITIVRNEFNDLSRKLKQPLPLLTDEDGEWYIDSAEGHKGLRITDPAGQAVLSESWVTADPADEFEESESLEELMNSTAEALAKLSPRQQQAMLCELDEKIGETLQLIQALRKHRVEVKTVDWPKDRADKKILKASLSPARHKLAESLGLDLNAYKKRA